MSGLKYSSKNILTHHNIEFCTNAIVIIKLCMDKNNKYI